MRPKFVIRMKRSYWVKPKKGEVLGHWQGKRDNASPVSLREARIYLKDWEKYGAEALLVLGT